MKPAGDTAHPAEDVDFAEDELIAQQPARKPWKLLIVDDDRSVHTVSQMVLRDLVFEERPVQLLSARTGSAAREIIVAHPDLAVMLVDVVMETEHAGLDLVRYVRDELGNTFVRIILRTGQPGQAPEHSVVVDYDINDYKEKTELTSQRLLTAVISALRAYRDIQIIEASRRGLEHIIESSRDLFERRSLTSFCTGVLQQLGALLNIGEDSLYLRSSGFTASCERDRDTAEFRVLAANGQFEGLVDRQVGKHLPSSIRHNLEEARKARRTLLKPDCFVGFFQTSNGAENLIYLQTLRPLTEFDKTLLDVFATNIGVAFDNIFLNQELSETQTEIIHTLSEVVETRSNETGRHVVRVGEAAYLLGKLMGLPSVECDMIRMVAPMHDIGKIGVPDVLLEKPGRYTPEEYEQMKQHAQLGEHILRGSQRLPMRSAAIIAGQHHEWWDGSGYPRGLSGDQIHLYGRIVCLADVFDALSSPRSYKPAWPRDKVVEFIATNSGRQFDPVLVDVFLAHQDAFFQILENYAD